MKDFVVDPDIIKAWKAASPAKRKAVENKLKMILTHEFFDDDKDAFIQYLLDLHARTTHPGVGQEMFDNILLDEL
jgi:hypothetical protein